MLHSAIICRNKKSLANRKPQNARHTPWIGSLTLTSPCALSLASCMAASSERSRPHSPPSCSSRSASRAEALSRWP